MSSHTGYLERELRENLKLRSELGAKAAEAKAAIQAERGSRIAYRLGRVLYWACLALIGLYWAGMVLFMVESPRALPDFSHFANLVIAAALFGIPSLALYGVGRACRYILSGK